MNEENKLQYIIPDKPIEKPKGDMSLITDYDQRYINIISKIFKKELSKDDLNNLLNEGAKIGAYWHKFRLVGAIVWTWDNQTGIEIIHMGFKKKAAGRGFEEALLEYAVFVSNGKLKMEN